MLAGAFLCTRGVGYGGVQILLFGAIFVLGTLFERWRYNNKNAAADADWQVTTERFVDPESGKVMEVLYDPRSGERRYRETGSP
jgi:hypothetical protein